MNVVVLYLGPSADWAGVPSERVELEASATLDDLVVSLQQRHPALKDATTVRFAVNLKFASPETVLRHGDEVALIPPVSGGGADHPVHVELTPEPIDAARVVAFARGDRRFGGIVTFEGVTRSESDAEHGALRHLEYQAYEAMALRELRGLVRRTLEGWRVGRVALVHRVGTVLPGEPSVVIAVAAGHRADAFDACRFLIDGIKADVPIWKRDVYEDGFTRWVERRQPPNDPRM